MLKINLYGDISIKINDCDITQQLSKKSIGIIAYLLNMPNCQASKDSLRDLFWIDAGEKAAYNLRFNLWNIKKYIPEVDGENFIITRGKTCRINSKYPIEKSDIDKLPDLEGDEYMKVLIDLSKSGSGAIFLEHFYLKDCDNFNDWVALERNNKERKLLAALSRAQGYFESLGEYDIALGIIERMIALSPFEDEYRISRMMIFAKQNKTVEIIKEYNNYNQWLKNEMGIEPSRKLKETYATLVDEHKYKADKIIIKDKTYDMAYEAVIDMLKAIIPNIHKGISVEIENWDNLDQKSRELIELLDKEKIIILGGK